MSCVDPINLPGLLKATRQYRNTDPPVNTLQSLNMMMRILHEEKNLNGVVHL